MLQIQPGCAELASGLPATRATTLGVNLRLLCTTRTWCPDVGGHERAVEGEQGKIR